MKKKILGVTLATSLLLMGSTVFAGTIPKVIVNGNKTLMQVSPFIQNGTTYIPIRSNEQLGFQVDWNPTTNTVVLNDGKNNVVQMVGSNVAKANGKDVNLGAPAIIKDGTTFVPIRFISTALGGTAVHDSKTNTINVTYKINTKVDDFGRPIKTSGTLPKRMARYNYYTMGTPTAMYDMNFYYEGMKGTIVENEDYISPVKMDQYGGSEYTFENRKIWYAAIDKHFDSILNLSYKSIPSSWVTDVVNTMTVDMDYYGPRFTKEAKDYINYVQKNKIVIEGDYYVEPNITYETMYRVMVRVWVKFKFTSPTLSTAQVFYTPYSDFKTGVWYQGYVDVPLGTNVGGKGKNFRMQSGSNIGVNASLSITK